MPHCCIGVDVITGFPSESDADFQETFDFLHDLDISYLHVFTYSERENTHALEISPVVPKAVRHQRTKSLRNLSYQKMRYFIESHYGQQRPVLFEGKSKNARLPNGQGQIEGYTDNYIRISAPYKKEWINQIIEQEIN
jgi:threonylcarbamoyladenosine tRNA methylthiotransferase MtaB